MRWRSPTRSGFPPAGLWLAPAGIVVALIVTAPLVEVDVARLAGAPRKLVEFLGHLVVMPDWDYLPDLWQKMRETLEMSFLATVIATALSLPLGVLAARNASPHPAVFHAVRQLLSVMRALPELVWALVFVSALGLGPLPGIMAMAFVTVGFMGKAFAEAIEVADPRPVEGVTALGASHGQVLSFALLPQAMPDLVGTTVYVLDHNVRAAAILGLVGAGGIGYDMVMAMRLFEYERIVLIALAIYVVVTLLDRLSDRLRARLIHG
jgi:phosphonate transport system permease protein